MVLSPLDWDSWRMPLSWREYIYSSSQSGSIYFRGGSRVRILREHISFIGRRYGLLLRSRDNHYSNISSPKAINLSLRSLLHHIRKASTPSFQTMVLPLSTTNA